MYFNRKITIKKTAAMQKIECSPLDQELKAENDIAGN